MFVGNHGFYLQSQDFLPENLPSGLGEADAEIWIQHQPKVKKKERGRRTQTFFGWMLPGSWIVFPVLEGP